MQTAADLEYDSTAPYGRKPNGQPYKTKPSLRNAIKKYHSNNKDVLAEAKKRHYAKNARQLLDGNMRWQANNKDKVRQYQQKYYLKNRGELEYYRELFTLSLESV